MSDKRVRPLTSSLSKLFTKDKKREAQLEELQVLLDYGTEEQFLALLVSWGVPREESQHLLNEFRAQRREARTSLIVFRTAYGINDAFLPYLRLSPNSGVRAAMHS